jgi:hypothetical protein
MAVEFIHIGNAYINVNSIAFIEVEKAGLTIHIQGAGKPVLGKSAPEVQDFLDKHTVLNIQKQPHLPGGGRPGSLF